jgi:hypothetical protein
VNAGLMTVIGIIALMVVFLYGVVVGWWRL